MKNLKTFLFGGFIFSNILFSEVGLPPAFKKTFAFEILGESPQKKSQSLIEFMGFGQQKPYLISLNEGERVFLMTGPRVDRCGFLHFEGSRVTWEIKSDSHGDEIRFYEGSQKIDISCLPVPFPRCGTVRSTESASSGEFLMEQLQLFGAQCQAQLVQDKQLLEIYQIQVPKGFTSRLDALGFAAR